MANEGFLLSVATLCRRHVQAVAGIQLDSRLLAERAAVDSILAHLDWRKCCRF
jgi:hypothetical protein